MLWLSTGNRLYVTAGAALDSLGSSPTCAWGDGCLSSSSAGRVDALRCWLKLRGVSDLSHSHPYAFWKRFRQLEPGACLPRGL